MSPNPSAWRITARCAVFGVGIALLVACGDASSPVEATEAAAAPTVATSPTATLTASPSPTPQPSPTPTATPEPSPTPTVVPTATPQPSPTPPADPTATPRPSPTPTLAPAGTPTAEPCRGAVVEAVWLGDYFWSHSEASEVRAALDCGADVEATKADGWTPLHLAAALSNKPTVVALLLDRGANIRATGDDGWTALHAAAMPLPPFRRLSPSY